MRISCPQCRTRYELPDGSVKSDGRKVRCKRCGNTWTEFPKTATQDDFSERTALFGADDMTEVRPVRNLPPAASYRDESEPGRARRRVPWAALALAASLIGVVVGGVVAREPIVNMWPPANLLFDTVGLGVMPPGVGLALQNPRSEQRREDGATVLVVEGQIVNVSDHEQMVPRVKAVAMDSERNSLQTWTIDASAASLQPGEIATFFSTHKDPGPVALLTLTFDVGDAGLGHGEAHAEMDPHAAPARAAHGDTGHGSAGNAPAPHGSGGEGHAAPASGHAQPREHM